MKDGLSETGNGMENLLLYKAVCLVFRPGKKVLGDSLNLRLWNKSSARTATWFRRDEDKDDKKRRAELILRQSMKNQQELTQLRVPVEAKHRQFLAFFQDYWNTETGWDREQLRDILPEDMMKKLDLYILSPVEEDVDDYYWTFEESGNFSISSAYALTNYGNSGMQDEGWKKICKLKVANRIRMFIWLVRHGCILCNEERKRRHLIPNGNCPWCSDTCEDVEHAIRRCNKAGVIWKELMGISEFQRLDLRNSRDWLDINIKGEINTKFG
nr:transcription initiation factor TFIID subunit 8 [Ipomoea batatas]